MQVKDFAEVRENAIREYAFTDLLNNQPAVDVQLQEAVKALMMLRALRLYDDYRAEKPVPTFVWLMFARDTSENPKSFFTNHLNHVGDAAGLEQVRIAVPSLRGHYLGERFFTAMR